MAETKETMTAKVAAKGEEIAALKKAKGAKDAGIKPLVDELLALKAQYKEVTGEPFPKPAAAPKKSKGPAVEAKKEGGGLSKNEQKKAAAKAAKDAKKAARKGGGGGDAAAAAENSTAQSKKAAAMAAKGITPKGGKPAAGAAPKGDGKTVLWCTAAGATPCLSMLANEVSAAGFKFTKVPGETTGVTVRALPGRSSALRVSHRESVFYGTFVWACRALNGRKRRFPARADAGPLGVHAHPLLPRRRGSHRRLLHRALSGPARGGRSSALRVFYSKIFCCGACVWARRARRALNGSTRRRPGRGRHRAEQRRRGALRRGREGGLLRRPGPPTD
jgi:hypothetical protein